MATKRKRKPRTELGPQVDTLKPLPLEIVGSKDDPCFGKLNDPRHPSCQRCGDVEICAIMMGQNNHIKRAQAEATQSFKDIEETKIPPRDRATQIKEIKTRIREMIKQGPISKKQLVDDIFGKYLNDGFTQKYIGKLIDRVHEKSNYIEIIKNQYQWKK